MTRYEWKHFAWWAARRLGWTKDDWNLLIWIVLMVALLWLVASAHGQELKQGGGMADAAPVMGSGNAASSRVRPVFSGDGDGLRSTVGSNPTPATKPDWEYWSAVAITGAGVAADAWSTVSRIHSGRYLNNPLHYCNYEQGTPWLYGEKPTITRVAGVMGAEFGLAVVSSHFLRKRQREGRGMHGMGYLWMVPLGWEASVHWQGAVRNWENCR